MTSSDEKAIRAGARRHGQPRLSRREVLRRVSAVLGGAAIAGQSAWLAGCAASRPDSRTLEQLFVSSDIALLDEIADTILPETATPGAKAAAVGPFIALMVADTYTADEQARFTDGLRTLDAESRRQLGVGFMNATAAQRTSLLERIDAEQFDYMRSHASEAPPHYFRMIKELTLLGYFTSEIGCTQAQRYLETPGSFEPCVPYASGDRAWAAHA
jgi:hypothetical protein